MLLATGRRPRVLTWHVHGAYLYYLTHADCDFFVPVKPGRPEGYGGRAGSLPWPDNLHEIAAEDVPETDFDCVLFQSARNYRIDQYEILTDAQRCLPRVYLEHDPPRESPTDTLHPVNDPEVLLVHVTHFNRMAWDAGRTPTHVIEHGVVIPEDIEYSGDLDCGIVVVNNLLSRGRRLGLDVYMEAASRVPLQLAGMGSEVLPNGVGEMSFRRLLETEAQHRFFFNPIRYTSMGLAVCEAMAIGLPIVGLATTEMPSVIDNEVNGFVSNNLDLLIDRMQALIADRDYAARLSRGARETARSRFGIERFARDWEETFARVIDGPTAATQLPSRRQE